MRILISCVPGLGHLHPLLPLAGALVDHGHTVAFATGADLREHASNFGFLTFTAGLRVSEAFGQLALKFPGGEFNRLGPDEILDWYVPHLFGEVFAPAMLRDLERLTAEWQPDILVHDCWEFAAPVVAAARGIPSVCQTLGPCFDITPPSLQPPSVASSNRAHPLRPLPAPPAPSERAPEWLVRRGAEPLVYMTLGTNTNADLRMFRAAVEALDHEAVDVLITTGSASAVAALHPVPANVHVEAYVPQAYVLPRCSAVICHAGAGTTLAALARSVPLLLLPQGADQYRIADFVARSGAALRLAPPEVTPARVRQHVLSLLAEDHYRRAAARIAREIAAMPDASSAAVRVANVTRRK